MENLGEIEEGTLDNSEDHSGANFTRPILDESIQSGFLNRSSLEGSIQSQRLLRSSLEGSVQTGSLNRSLDDSASSQWQRQSTENTLLQTGTLENSSADISKNSKSYQLNQTVQSGPLDISTGYNESIHSGLFDKYLQSQSIQSGALNQSDADQSTLSNQSIPSGILDRYLQNESWESGSLSGFIPPSSGGNQNLSVQSGDLNKSQANNSVQSGYLDNSSQQEPPNKSSKSLPNNTSKTDTSTESAIQYNDVQLRSHNITERSSSNSNRSSISVKSSSNLSFHSQYSSEEEMKEMTSRISSPGDLENMMVEVGNLNNSHISPSDFQTAIANRDTVISRLSSSLNQVMQERGEDGVLANKLEEEVEVLKDQVKFALEKASKYKEFKTKFQELSVDHESLRNSLEVLKSELDTKSVKVDELEEILKVKNKEISNFKTSKNILLDKLQSVQDQVNEKSFKDENYYKMKLDQIESAHADEINDINEKHEKELQEMLDKHEEEQVIELNLLDMELERLKDEKIELKDQLEMAREEIETYKSSKNDKNYGISEQLNEVQSETESLVNKLTEEKALILEKLSSIEKLYEDEKKNLEKEKFTRESLELDLASLGSMLDETQYQFLPRNVRESLEKSVRLSIESGRLSTSRRESLSLIFAANQSITTPPNVTQGDFEYQINDNDITPTHKPVQVLADEAEVVTALKAQHEKEMCELRKYFENVCKELEMKYRAEIEENMKRNVPTPGWMGVGLTSGPVSLELGPAQIEFEFESMSPRSGFSSDNNQISFNSNYQHSREHSGISMISDAETESDTSNRNAPKETDSDKDSQTYKHDENKFKDSLSPNIRKQHEEQVARLQTRIGELESELEKNECFIKGNLKEIEAQTIREEYEEKIKEIEAEYRGAIELARANVKKELEAEHLQKFQMVSKQIQSLQKSELDKLKSDLSEEHSIKIQNINEQFRSEIKSLEDALKDIQESHKFEINELNKKYKNQMIDIMRDQNGQLKEITPDIYEAMKDDMENLERERDHLRSMQTLMKELITDLALHYNLSEKQLKFLSESTVFDSFNALSTLPDSKNVSPINTPFKYFKQQLRGASSKSLDSSSLACTPQTSGCKQTPTILALKAALAVCSPLTAGEIQSPSILDVENLTDGSFDSNSNSAQSEQILLELREKVKVANNSLLELGQSGGMFGKLSTVMSTPAIENKNGEALKGDEEKARLELQLEEAHQRIQELELSNRASLGRSDVISGCGEAGGIGVEMGEVRERASKVLSNYREDQEGLGVDELVSVLGELLVYSDNICAQAKDRVEDIEQQLEVADKQLKSTRAFLEEQAIDRDQEREEWEKRFQELEKLKKESVGKIECDDEDSGDLDSERSQTPQQKVVELENELSAAVDKIYELRDIIRGLEQKLESRIQGEIHQGEVVKELRLALEEAVIGHQLMQQELELLRSSSSDAEFVEHIRGLEEQLGSKTQELKKHRAAANHIQDIRAQLRGLEERVEQSTRELEHSVCDHLGSSSTSSCSSRQSSPVPAREVEGGSFEDIGSSLSGLEVEEVARLEKKLKYLEKAETAAVDRVKKLEADNKLLVKKLQESESKLKEMDDKCLSLKSELETSKGIIKDNLSLEEKWKHELQQQKIANERLEEIEEERCLLQERVTQQQMQISSLQSSIQSSRHRVGSGGKEDTQKLLREKELQRAELEQLKVGFKICDAEKNQAVEKVQILKGNVLDLESKLDMMEKDSEVKCTQCSKMSRDISELKEVNEKLQTQLSVARAAQLAAQKTEMPLLAQKLLDEKNQEIDILKNQIVAFNTSLPINQMKHSTPNSIPWSSKLEDSRGSVEQLRDASQMRERLPELSLDTLQRVNNSVKLLPSSTQKLQTIQENDGLHDSFAQISNKFEKNQVVKKLPITDLDTSSNHEANTSSMSGLGTELELKETIPQPEPDYTQGSHVSSNFSEDEIKSVGHLEEVLHTKVAEIEFMTEVLNQKEDLVENLQDNVEDLEAKVKSLNEHIKEQAEANEDLVEKLNTEIVEKTKIEEASLKNIDLINKLTVKLNSSEEKIQDLEKRVLTGGDPNLVQEIRVLREERQDRIEGMENLHQIIENAQNQIESKNQELQLLKEELSKVETNINIKENSIAISDARIKELEASLNEKLEQVLTMEGQIQEIKESLCRSEQQKRELEMKLAEHITQPNVDKVLEEKLVLETQLEKVTMEMASVQKVVTEMTLSFKNQILIKDQELKKVCDNFKSISSIKSDLEKRCSELDNINQVCKEKIDQLEKKVLENTTEVRKELNSEKFLEHGSLDDLSNLVQAELDLSSELDNTLLSQVVSGLGLDQTDVSTSSTGISEVQRLLKKIQGDGIKVLSLSERLFLMQHANVSQNINIGDVKPERRFGEDNGSKERELERKLGVLEFQLEQEKVLSQDLRKALATEKKNGLDNLSKIGKERLAKSDLETQLEKVEKELDLVRTSFTKAQYQLSLRGNQLHFNSDSENEEFLNTIEAQKVQIISLEESLKLEKENFSQLQHVLEVERGRGKRDGTTGRWDEKTETRLLQLQEDLNQERIMRRNLEDSVMTDDIGRMIINQLQKDLEYEREKLKELESVLNKERKKYSDLYVEYDHLRKSSPNMSTDTGVKKSGQESLEFEKQMRSKNLELERYSSELEMKHDMMEREMRRVRGEIARLECELKEERERNLSGLNKDQLVRMKQVNTFLEHNLKENGEMLQSLAKLHEEKQQMKKVNWELQDKLGQCVCLSSGGGASSWSEPDQKTFYGKYLRAESFRKALVWQKRYLLVLLCGELVPDPVLRVVRENKLGRNGRFRSIVHSIISISRMKFLVKRWRSGKRAGAHAISSKPWSETLFTGRSSEAPNTGRSSAGVPSLELNSPADGGVSLSPSLGISTSARSQFTKSQSVPSYNLVSPKRSSPTPSSRLPPSYSRPRNPPTFGRSHSLRSSVPRPTTLGLNGVPSKSGGDDISVSSSNPSSNSSHQAPAVTGFTPPTRDTMTRRSRSSAPGAPEDANSQVRRSLGAQFRDRNTILAAVGDNTLQRDLEEYIRRFGSLQENRAKHF